MFGEITRQLATRSFARILAVNYPKGTYSRDKREEVTNKPTHFRIYNTY